VAEVVRLTDAELQLIRRGAAKYEARLSIRTLDDYPALRATGRTSLGKPRQTWTWSVPSFLAQLFEDVRKRELSHVLRPIGLMDLFSAEEFDDARRAEQAGQALRELPSPNDESRMGRITLRVPSGLQPLPWEETLERYSETPARVVLRRIARPRGAPPATPLALPYLVEFGGASPKIEESYARLGRIGDLDRASSSLFRTAALGTGEGDQVTIAHVMFDPNAGPSELLARLDGLARAQRWRPRVVVLESIRPLEEPSPWLTAIVNILERISEACVVVDTAVSGGEPEAFASTFYQGLTRNWPLDRALQQSSLAVRGPRRPAVPHWLGARPGGETAVLLSRAVFESARVRSGVRGRIRIRALATDAGLRAPQVQQELRVEWPVELGQGSLEGIEFVGGSQGRSSRAAQDLRFHVGRAVRAKTRGAVEVTLDDIDFTRIEDEPHGADEIIQATRNLRAQADQWHADAELVTLGSDEELAAQTHRMTNIWFASGGTLESMLVASDPVSVGRTYRLNVEIASARAGAFTVPLDESPIKQLLEERGSVWLDVYVLGVTEAFELKAKHKRLRLPRIGPAGPIYFRIVPLAEGRQRLRVCICHRMTVLQSVAIGVTVSGAETPTGAEISAETDYVASSDLALLHELARPRINIVTNRDEQGTHWVSLLNPRSDALPAVKAQHVFTFSDTELIKLGANARTVLFELEGPQDSYRYATPLSLLSPDAFERRERRLLKMALAGWNLYDNLFLAAGDGAAPDTIYDDYHGAGVISVAHCRNDGPSVPWAAIYDRYLESNSWDADGLPTDLSLCQVFKDSVAPNRWSTDGLTLTDDSHDVLDDPDACHARSDCPLKGPNADHTVCPFGFWGVMHQIEQPLQQVVPTATGVLPPQLADPSFNQTSFIDRLRGQSAGAGLGFYPGIAHANEHREALEALPGVDTVYKEDAPEVLAMLKSGPQHFFYFYCHGEQQDGNFVLKLGPMPPTGPQFIASSSVSPLSFKWKPPPQPLVILNGCDTVAFTSEVTNTMMAKLRSVGASGVVGTEIQVWSQLASKFGLGLLERMTNLESIGEAVLGLRRDLMRQYNPLGLIYTSYAPATLHLHDDQRCDWCAAHAGGI